MDLKRLYAQALDAKKKGDLQTAFNNLQQCIQASPAETAYRLNFAVVANEMARPSDQLREMAYFHASEACRLRPEVIQHWVALGEIALNCYKFLEAISAYEKAVEMDPRNEKVWGILGFAYARIGKGKESKRCYLRALELNPELGDVHFLLSCMFTDEDYDPAKQAYHGERGFQAKQAAPCSVESCNPRSP